jgi:hypothetical protein
VKQKGDIKGFVIIVVDWKGGADVSNSFGTAKQ